MTIQFMIFKECVDKIFILNENKNIFERLSLMTSVLDGNSIIFLKKINNKVIASYVVNKYTEDTLETIFIEVDKDYRNQGVATELMKAVINYCKNHNKKIITSDFSKEGEKYIKCQMRNIANENNVNYYTSKEEYEWFN